MSDLNEYGRAIHAGLAAIVLLLTIKFILRPALVELYRQRVFELRRAMFVDYVDGKIDAERAYRLMVSTMNSLIRYADHVSFGRAFLGMAVLRRSPDEMSIAFADADDTSRKLLNTYRNILYYETSRHMLLTSPLMWTVLLATLPAVALTVAIMSLLRMVHVMRAFVARIVSAFGRAVSVDRIVSETHELLPEEWRDSQPGVA
jgi:hypothetical protein